MKKYILPFLLLFPGGIESAESEPLTPKAIKNMERAYMGGKEDDERQVFCLVNKNNEQAIVLLEAGNYQDETLSPQECVHSYTTPDNIYFIRVLSDQQRPSAGTISKLKLHLIDKNKHDAPEFDLPVFWCAIPPVQKCYVMLKEDAIVPQKPSRLKAAFCRNTNEHDWSLKFNIDEDQLKGQGKLVLK